MHDQQHPNEIFIFNRVCQFVYRIVQFANRQQERKGGESQQPRPRLIQRKRGLRKVCPSVNHSIRVRSIKIGSNAQRVTEGKHGLFFTESRGEIFEKPVAKFGFHCKKLTCQNEPQASFISLSYESVSCDRVASFLYAFSSRRVQKRSTARHWGMLGRFWCF